MRWLFSRFIDAVLWTCDLLHVPPEVWEPILSRIPESWTDHSDGV